MPAAGCDVFGQVGVRQGLRHSGFYRQISNLPVKIIAKLVETTVRVPGLGLPDSDAD